MTALILIPIVAVLVATLYRTARPERIGFVERTARGCRPLPPLSRRQRLHRWMALYGQTTVEQRIDPGAWPFQPSAVHGLPKSQQVDPRELIR
jgi:hypothetical protein